MSKSCAKNPSNYHRYQPLEADFCCNREELIASMHSHPGIPVIEIYFRPRIEEQRWKKYPEVENRENVISWWKVVAAKRPLKEIIRRFFSMASLTVITVVSTMAGLWNNRRSGKVRLHFARCTDSVGGIAFKSNYGSGNFSHWCSCAEGTRIEKREEKK